MIYDAFIFFNELDLLEIRLNELDQVVDRFVIVEATHTFSGNIKPLYYGDNKARFKKFHEKIIHIVVHDMPTDGDSWKRERWQRNQIIRGLKACRPNDIVMVSDADEIPNAKAVVRYASAKEYSPVAFNQKCYYYYVNCQSNNNWNGLRALRYSDVIKFPEIETIRHTQFPNIDDAGWHFSYLGGISAIQKKLEAYSHQEYNTDQYKDPERMSKLIEAGSDIFGRPGLTYHFVDLDESFPPYLVKNKKKFASLIYNKSMPEDWGTMSCIADKLGTDKGPRQHYYTRIYEDLFDKNKDDKLTILEIGAGSGASPKLWKAYFSKAKVISIDNNPDCNVSTSDRVAFHVGDQANFDFLSNVVKSYDGLDIVIDDGSHIWSDQIDSFKYLFPYVKPGGLYIVEDVHTSYWRSYARGEQSAITFFKSLVDTVNMHGVSGYGEPANDPNYSELKKNPFFRTDIRSITFYKSLVVVKKI